MLNKKCVLIKERFIALPIITAPLFKAYQHILVESITQGHDTKKEIWKLRIGEVLEVYIYRERESGLQNKSCMILELMQSSAPMSATADQERSSGGDS